MSTLCPPMDGAPVPTTAPLLPDSFRRNETSPFRCTAQPPRLGLPPPPPPLPPPPPPPPSIGDPFTRTVQRRSKMRNFNWDAIPRHSVLGKRNVWTAQRNFENFELDTKRMEELFSQNEHHGLVHKGGPIRKSVWDLSQIITESENVSILNSKKSMNIGILLKQFKRPPQDIVEAVRHGNLCFATGKLRELNKLLPDDIETKKLMSFNGDVSSLNDADRFMVMLVQVPGYKVRLKSLLLREEFFLFIEEIKHSIAVMTTAANELLACDDLHSIIRLVLKAGNYMNAQAQQIDEVLLHFPEQLQHIGIAARIQKQEVEMDFQRELEKIREAKMDARKQPDLFHQMEAFLLMADIRLADVEASLQELDNISTSVAEYFCEDPAAFKLEECCSIFHSFCERFERATQENREREAAEARMRRQKEREMLNRTAKRRSTATCSDRDPSDEASALESVLASFFNQRPSRRRHGGFRPVKNRPIKNIRPQVEERESRGDLDSPAETNEEKFEILRVQEPEDICQKEELLPCAINDVQRARAASKRGQCIVDELILESINHKEGGCSNTSTKQEHVATEDGAMAKEVEEIGDLAKEVEEIGDLAKEVEEIGDLAKEVEEIGDLAKEVEEIGDLAKEVEEIGDLAKEVEEIGFLAKEVEETGDLDKEVEETRDFDKEVEETGDLDKEMEETGDMDKGGGRNVTEITEEADKMPEISGKIFRFQDCEGLNGAITPEHSRGHGVCSSTPRQRNIKEVDLALQNGLGGLGSPWTILSPRVSPRNTPNRRHSFSISRVDILDDGVWALPDTPVRDKPCFSHKSGKEASSLPDCPSKRTPAHTRSASLNDEKEPVNFKLGQIFQRRNGQELPPDKRSESSGLVSFFRRFGERNRAGTVG
ncbi:FH2 domain containing 3 isoform X2 [Pseudorasbora parva]|uniref:FH2 domain containing 3 isoform X2 n=1 Tax=Pseudorasbora parva TaxID=51549 RepID=UPI00351E6808